METYNTKRFNRFAMALIASTILTAATATAQQSSAASWDGQHGPLTVATITTTSGDGGNIPGLPGAIPGPLTYHTAIYIKSADPMITGVRVELTVKDDKGEQKCSLVANMLPDTGGGTHGGVSLLVNQTQIVGTPTFTLLYDGVTY